jgi:hypothetical protein
MKANSRIRFNPVTKEIEVEGSESFVKTYFGKLQTMVSGPAVKTAAAKKEPKAAKATPVKADKKKSKAVQERPQKKTRKVAKTKPGGKGVTNMDMIVGLIQGSTEGISTTGLKEKTGLSRLQIWSIVNRAAKAGKIKKERRGLYVAV